MLTLFLLAQATAAVLAPAENEPPKMIHKIVKVRLQCPQGEVAPFADTAEARAQAKRASIVLVKARLDQADTKVAKAYWSKQLNLLENCNGTYEDEIVVTEVEERRIEENPEIF